MTEEAIPDYSDFVDGPDDTDKLGQLSSLAEQLNEADHTVEQAQEALKAAQAAQRDLSERQIPELMESVGMEEFSTTNGLKIKVKEAIRASAGRDGEKVKTINWLIDNGHEAIIKLSVGVAFGRGEEQRNAAKELAEKLQGEGIPATMTQDVNAQTLSALVRELLQEGIEVPEDTLHVYRQRTAKIT